MYNLKVIYYNGKIESNAKSHQLKCKHNYVYYSKSLLTIESYNSTKDKYKYTAKCIQCGREIDYYNKKQLDSLIDF